MIKHNYRVIHDQIHFTSVVYGLYTYSPVQQALLTSAPLVGIDCTFSLGFTVIIRFETLISLSLTIKHSQNGSNTITYIFYYTINHEYTL